MRFLFAAILMLAATPAFALDHFTFDKDHTNIVFHISHLGFSQMIGLMTSYDGTFQFEPTKPEQSVIDVTIHPTGTITTGRNFNLLVTATNPYITLAALLDFST